MAAPAAAMRPSRTVTVPFSTSPTGPGVTRCALVIANVCAAAVGAAAARARARAAKTGSRRCISFLPDRLADFKIASVSRRRIARVEDQRAVDENLLGDRIDAERIFAPQNHVGHLAGLERRSEEHTSELQSLMRISYAVFCLQK